LNTFQQPGIFSAAAATGSPGWNGRAALPWPRWPPAPPGRARPRRAYNVCDDSQMKMGDWFELAARLCGLPCPPRMPRAEAEAALPALQMSFLRESRRLTNQRLKRELRLKLRYPTAESGLKAALLLD